MSNDHMRNVHPDLPGGKVKSRKYRKIIFGTYEQIKKKQACKYTKNQIEAAFCPEGDEDVCTHQSPGG